MSEFFIATNANGEPVYCISSNGFVVYNPLVSECGRFAVEPSYYGLTAQQVKSLAHLNAINNYNTEL
jgi:hypothetical protein